MTGRCYCGRARLTASALPQTVTYCHCSDCRRLSGAPVAAFAAFARDQVNLADFGPAKSVTPGVNRWFCTECGTQLAATYDYLPDQVYVPIGLLDQAADLPAEGHGHTDSALPWLHIEDDLPRDATSARDRLQETSCKG
ncbi:GFA family protein [Jannaschia sp. CCS1]|uniref:GFA family protein n=1 Tax=Jannaschia sp. (strain CCS1) TaxID=290400 RepID=UPI000053CFF7|nr:GFA family protein [Jannaschia sp. CCS1]ABD53781.1 glutathione-dependent formaldehyde-activating GFA [Jannaschia sp. CCS1]